ncbi:GNAT family N-acetyltransferase [Aestuariivirga sp. YIM B02566]|uniref:GNAT family N-acetyltransferase n=1 Tax=Taklimakanibacter albus TaxID=2800327 RepID=A0ACC5R024_9HYPH|nr:GNAT family N-acetyltransferase [Aestuariivirga sp. YIM B02566]MBK1866019.1 GNAT family N-acetyltransferase [Aestuariivirga sp. YIM B02566]
MRVRPAIEADAEQAALVLRRSITELCIRDHGNDPALLASWLANKTPEKFREWVRQEDSLCLVAVAGDDTILGVALMSKVGEIRLNYVSPDARFQGVSTALVGALEAAAASLGVPRLSLNSTATAHPFYLARGFQNAGQPQTDRLKENIYPMAKSVALREG